jgi:hypothetical protein
MSQITRSYGTQSSLNFKFQFSQSSQISNQNCIKFTKFDKVHKFQIELCERFYVFYFLFSPCYRKPKNLSPFEPNAPEKNKNPCDSRAEITSHISIRSIRNLFLFLFIHSFGLCRSLVQNYDVMVNAPFFSAKQK